jgi:hypothetical protein
MRPERKQPMEGERAMSVAVLDRSLDQRMAALRRANEVRTGNKEVKRKLLEETLSFEEAIEIDTIQSMRSFDLLMAIPKVGRVKASKALRVLGISPSKRVGALSDRQRRSLVAWARQYSPESRRLAA